MYLTSVCFFFFFFLFFVAVIVVLILSAWQTKTNICANSIGPDETARSEPSHQDLQCLPVCFYFILF